MKCEDVQDLLSEYAEEQLPEITKRRIENHLDGCESCRSDYRFWKESGTWIQAEREQYSAVATAKSIVDAVMARILSEEKWAIPLGRKVFTLTARMRRIGASAAAILLLICAFSLYTNTSADDQALLSDNAIIAMVPGDKAEVTKAGDDGNGVVIESISPVSQEESELPPQQLIPPLGQPEGEKPNYGLILGVFGILITVLAMSWMTRVKDRA
ncbi:hypothetical protein G3578_05085 [Brevibacillus sp. SYP-B805]|uniref:zf-HC2 domain-containing protein n=1 Tax=Brevibacillus sp. SYP-B805 TaxID=1578199 RepID=UPI0013EA8A8C|nr:zf-HC2 domain-containing protein [Brevibacillus sp. SYP-B805]NGQ94554.1 hypothetical protein [Brevibacillus sp. SYP-B805]